MEDRAPWLYRVVAARSGQSEPMGLLFIIGLTVMASAVLVVLGGQALQDTQTQADLQRAEHVMTLLDSRAAAVALSDSSGQRLEFPESGTHTVREGTGWIRISHTNYSGSGNTEIIYNGTMGSVTYETSDTTIAYQGGGVWRLGPTGEAQVVSQPEFHYRGSTLTLPVIRVTGSGSVSGGGSATVRPVSRSVPVFPDTSSNYNGGGSPDMSYLNPAENGTMNVTVHSRYYEAWAEHFRSRTDGIVTLDHDAQTATVQLMSLGETGFFDMPVEQSASGGDDELLVRGLEGEHDLRNFTITIAGDSNIDNLEWSMYAEEGQKRIELHLAKQTGGGGIHSFIYFSTNGGEDYHGWRSVGTYTHVVKDIDDDGNDEEVLHVNWTGTKEMEYTNLSSSATVHFDNPEKTGSLILPVTWDEHGGTLVYRNGTQVSESVTFQKGDTSQIGNVTNHFFAQMGTEWELRVDDKEGSNRIDESISGGYIDYPGADQFITYLHVTENEIEVSLD